MYRGLREDLRGLEQERDRLRQTQGVMKELMLDLAEHFNLSERQVRFMSDSLIFDSFSAGAGEQQLTVLLASPQLKVHELTELLEQEQDRAAAPRGLEALRCTVREANSRLATPPATPGESRSSTWLGEEAGRMEVERARLEEELGTARSRIQELEGRRSLGREEVMVGLGEGGEGLVARLEGLGEARRRAAALLTSLEDEGEVS